MLIAIGGLSGTGKSTLARSSPRTIGPAPGALHVRSDVERKRLFGVPETQRLDRQHYRIGTAQRVYSIVEDKARRALAAGHPVIVDAVFAKAGRACRHRGDRARGGLRVRRAVAGGAAGNAHRARRSAGAAMPPTPTVASCASS